MSLPEDNLRRVINVTAAHNSPLVNTQVDIPAAYLHDTDQYKCAPVTSEICFQMSIGNNIRVWYITITINKIFIGLKLRRCTRFGLYLS